MIEKALLATATEHPDESPLQLALLKAWKASLAKQSNHEQIQAAMLKRRGWECRWVLVEEFGDKVDEWRRPCA